MRWFRFFLGTPRRLVTTLVALIVVYALIRPDDVGEAVNRAFVVLFGPVAMVMILLLVVRMIIGGRRR